MDSLLRIGPARGIPQAADGISLTAEAPRAHADLLPEAGLALRTQTRAEAFQAVAIEASTLAARRIAEHPVQASAAEHATIPSRDHLFRASPPRLAAIPHRALRVPRLTTQFRIHRRVPGTRAAVDTVAAAAMPAAAVTLKGGNRSRRNSISKRTLSSVVSDSHRHAEAPMRPTAYADFDASDKDTTKSKARKMLFIATCLPALVPVILRLVLAVRPHEWGTLARTRACSTIRSHAAYWGTMASCSGLIPALRRHECRRLEFVYFWWGRRSCRLPPWIYGPWPG